MKKFDNYCRNLSVLEQAYGQDREKLKDRNDTSYIYDGDMARQLTERILKEYIPAFVHVRKCVIERYRDVLIPI